MKILSITPTSYLHPACGREYIIVVQKGVYGIRFKIWDEFLFHIFEDYEGDYELLIEREITQQQIDQYENK